MTPADKEAIQASVANVQIKLQHLEHALGGLLDTLIAADVLPLVTDAQARETNDAA